MPNAEHRGQTWPLSIAPMMDRTDRHYRYFMRQIAELHREIVAVRSEFESHLRTANADMVAALTKSTEVIAHNSAIIEQITKKLGA